MPLKSKTVFQLVLFGSLSLAFSFSSFAKPPSWAPAHGYHKKHHDRDHYKHDNDRNETARPVVVEKIVHQYVYYPAQQVYYCPQQNKYYWLQQGLWKIGSKLPPAIQLGAQKVDVTLDTLKPYTEHAQTLARIAGQVVKP